MYGKSVLILFVILLFSSCPSTPPPFYIEKPDGFAFVESEDGKAYSPAFISPEGLIFDVTMAENYPQKNIDFWGKTLKNQFINNGYHLYKEIELTINENNPGFLFEWLAPYGSDTYVYLTFIAVETGNILIAEAAGEVKLFSDYRKSIVDSIKTISFNQKIKNN